MRSKFQDLIRHFMRFRHHDISHLTMRDQCRLLASFLREAHAKNATEALEFIAKLKLSTPLPLLLADFLDGKRNGPRHVSPPELTLADVLAQGILQWGELIVEKAWSEEEESLVLNYKHSSSSNRVVRFLPGESL